MPSAHALLFAASLVLLTAVSSALTPGVSAADTSSSETIVWLAADADAEAVDEIFGGIDEALRGQPQHHIVGRPQLRQHLDDTTADRPDCLLGIESCDSPESMAFRALQIGLLIRLDVESLEADDIKLNYEMLDRQRAIVADGQLDGADAHQLGVDVVASLFDDAVGVVSFESDPDGATVYVDDQPVGPTPLSQQFGIGDYDIRIEADGYRPYRDSVAVRAGEPARIEARLHRQPGRLRIDGAPDGATVAIDDEHYGAAGEVIDLEPGRHIAEIRADDYQVYRQAVDIEAGEVTEVSVEMRRRAGLLRDIEAADIAAHRLQLELGLEVGGHTTDYRNAHTVDEPRRRVFGSWTDFDGATDPDDQRRLVTPAGLRLGINWEGDHLGLGILSASLIGRSMAQRFALTDPVDGVTEQATMTGLRTLELRPMQLRARLFYENLAPYAQAGLGVAFHWLDVETESGSELRMRQTDPFAALEIGTRYHFDPRWSIGASYRLQANFAGGSGLEHTLGFAVGFGIDSIPFIDPRPPEQL